MKKHLEIDIDLVPGGPGQFEVRLDNEVIATRAKGWQRFFGGGWPSAAEVVEAIRAKRETKRP